MFSKKIIRNVLISIFVSLALISCVRRIDHTSLSENRLTALNEWGRIHSRYLNQLTGDQVDPKFFSQNGLPVEYQNVENGDTVIGYVGAAYDCNLKNTYRLIDLNLTKQSWKMREFGIDEWYSFDDFNYFYVNHRVREYCGQ